MLAQQLIMHADHSGCLEGILAPHIGTSNDHDDVSTSSSYHMTSAIVVTAVAPNKMYPLLIASRTVMTEVTL